MNGGKTETSFKKGTEERKEKMQFGWINLFGAVIVILLMIPNVIYAWKNRKQQVQDEISVPKLLIFFEQLGRYGCVLLMILPLFVWKFGFGSVEEMLLYLILNGGLVLSYYGIWGSYLKKKTLGKGLLLAIFPTSAFLLSGVLLRHWCLVVFALIFGIPHIRITWLTHRAYGQKG